MPERDCAIVVPCYNEAARLRTDEFDRFFDSGQTQTVLVFVDDGSRDHTRKLLDGIQARHPEQAAVLAFPANRGKAEAVRCGMNYAFERNFSYAGFWDADLATPLSAIAELATLLRQNPELDMVFGARVKLLGRHVERQASRHYIGRVFATAVSLVLRLPIYDTQCGAKVFRSTPEVRTIFQEPFLSRWIFDVEIIARYISAMRSPKAASPRIYEYPLHAWEDVAGSKLKPLDFCVAAYDLFRIRRAYHTRRVY